MKKMLTIFVILLLACSVSTSSPFAKNVNTDSSSPKLIIHNNYWDTRQVTIYCDGSQVKFIRGLVFNAVDNTRLNFCSGYYSFRVNNEWNSQQIQWQGGDIHLLIQSSLNLSTVYISR